MNKLEISEIQILPVRPQHGLIAFASCVINSQFYIGNIAIYTSPSSPDGFRLVYPLKVLPNGKQINCIYPICREAGKALHYAIIEQYKDIMNKFRQ